MQGYISKLPSSLRLALTLVQVAMIQKNVNLAIKYLQQFRETETSRGFKDAPAIISILVWLYELSGDKDNAMKLLETVSTNNWFSDVSINQILFF